MAVYLGAVMRAGLLFSVFFAFAAAAGPPDGFEGKAKAPLESLDLGRAAMSENPEAYLKALQKLINGPQKEIAGAFGAETAQGESLFHLMARAKTQREFFAGEILYAAAFLSGQPSAGPLYHWMIQSQNKKGETPLETARAADNELAYKNLMELELGIRHEGIKKGAKQSSMSEYEQFFYMQAGALASIGLIMLLHASDPFMINTTGWLALTAGLLGGAIACKNSFFKKKK